MSPTETAYPIRATYGETNQTHGLLTCSGDLNLLPPILLDLTDKPPGYTSSGEAWGPSVGCGPIGQWWALWWTEPDPSALRAGMVMSQVALWPLEEISEVHDLGRELEVLSGGKAISLPPPSIVALVAEALIADAASAPVFGNLHLWPGLLTMLWERLWPEARRAFSARVAISPSQGGESVAPPWLYGVDSGRLLEWTNSKVITSAVSETANPSRAARWLMGQEDTVLKELFESGTNLGSTLSTLRRIARAADHLETLRKAPEATTAIYLLRSLLNLSSNREELKDFKQEAISVLAATTPDASSDVIVSLANIPCEQLLDGERLAEIVASWIANVLPQTSVPNADKFLSRLEAGTAQEWWLSAVRPEIVNGLRSNSGHWNVFLLNWLSEKLHARFIVSLGIITDATERQLLTILPSSVLSAAQFSRLRQNAISLGWSGMHAIATLRETNALEALQSQLVFRPDPLLGLSIMVDQIYGEELVEATIIIANPKLTSLVATRTSKDPDLLANLDLGVPAWSELWAFHVTLGGNPWPTSVDIYLQAKKYLSSVETRNYRPGIIAQLAEDFAPIAIDLENRKNLWDRLDSTDARALATVVARLLLQRSHTAYDLPNPEPYLLSHVILQVPNSSLSSAQAKYLLRWDSSITESKAINLVRSIRDWSKDSKMLGEIVQERQWKLIARELASEYRHRKKYVLPALHACYALLGFFDKISIPRPSDIGSIEIERNEIIASIAEVGSEIAHDRLEDLWVRAGGRAASLPTSVNSADRWFRASNQAASGSLPEGLKALVRVLLDDFPNNEKLKLLNQLLINKSFKH